MDDLTNLIPSDMTDAAMWAVIVGFFAPIVVNLVVHSDWGNAAKAATAFGVSVIIGGGTAVFTGAYEGLGIPSSILLTFVVAIAAYSQFWKNVAPKMQRGSGQKIDDEDGVIEPTDDDPFWADKFIDMNDDTDDDK